ncbi:hypothetical protein F4811DRAFT_546779 [Daldinia bambusicola]|nr:hypothetical protein F4811DRAFT_546779 [Daldinia bambusicola]
MPGDLLTAGFTQPFKKTYLILSMIITSHSHFTFSHSNMAGDNKTSEGAWIEDEEGGALFPEPEGSPLFEGPDVMAPWEIAEMESAKKANAIVQDDTLDEPAKIDAIAAIRGWFHGPTEIVYAFLAGGMDAAEAAAKLVTPIDEMYTSADRGRAYYYSSGDIGFPPNIPKPPEGESDDESDFNSTECQLWELWYGILHAAKRIPWADTAQHERLISLVRAIKARPDPPPPSPMTKSLEASWIWNGGKLWSNLSLMGPSTREMWNECCGCGSGWTVPEQHAWTNINAFVARLVSSGTSTGFELYGSWALREALEDRLKDKVLHVNAPAVVQATVHITVASVWLRIAGRYMWSLRTEGGGIPPDLKVDLGLREKKLPWYGYHRDVGEKRHCIARWDFWKRRFEQERENIDLPEEVRELARGSAEIIKGFFEEL